MYYLFITSSGGKHPLHPLHPLQIDSERGRYRRERERGFISRPAVGI